MRGAADFRDSARPGWRRRASVPPPAGTACRGRRQLPAPAARCAAASSRRSAVASTSSVSASAGRDGSPRAHSCSRSAASAARPCSLLCTCKARKRCKVSFQATCSSSPKRAKRLRSPSHAANRAGDEARRRADQREALTRAGSPSAQRIATSPPSDQPSTVTGRVSCANAPSTAATIASSVHGVIGALCP